MKLPWMEIAEKEIGVKEPDDLKYFSATDYPNPNGKTPYCSAFENWCLKQAGIKGTGSAAAFSWKTWGKDVSDDKPVGAVVVFSFSHVAFYYGDGKFLGGNQTGEHEVCVEHIPMADAIAWRMPEEYV